MIETIRIGHLLRETVATPYRNLVTRPTGAAVRDRIERPLAAPPAAPRSSTSPTSSCWTSAAPTRSWPSCLIADAAEPERFVVLRGLREDQHEAIEHVLEPPPAGGGRGPAGPTADPGSSGWVTPDARAAFACVRDWAGRFAGDWPGRWAGPWSEPATRSRASPSTGWSARTGRLPPAAHRMNRRRLGLLHHAIHGAPERRPDWTPVSPT